MSSRRELTPYPQAVTAPHPRLDLSTHKVLAKGLAVGSMGHFLTLNQRPSIPGRTPCGMRLIYDLDVSVSLHYVTTFFPVIGMVYLTALPPYCDE